jgi:thiosulfate reductase cytochrome b subunit
MVQQLRRRKRRKARQSEFCYSVEPLMVLSGFLCFTSVHVYFVERRRLLFSRQTLRPSPLMSFSLQVIFLRVKSSNTRMSKYKSIPTVEFLL